MKFSTKLGLWFFLCILIIESISMFILHRHVVDSLVNEELESLLARGNSHRDVLETSYHSNTLHHIALMESNTNTEVVIVNEDRQVIVSSLPSSFTLPPSFFHADFMSEEDKMIQKDWEQEAYIATVSPFRVEDGTRGFVYMLKSTDQIQLIIQNLNHHFGIAVIVIMLFLLLTNLFLLKLLTKPLISMKEATKKISNGDFSVTLPIQSKDELGELSTSIQSLANHLNHLQKERKEFLAGISHELRTPLTYIQGYAELGKRTNLQEKERIEYLEIIHEESTRVSLLLENLFELAKMDQNSFTIQTKLTDMETFIQPIFEKAHPFFENAGIKLKFTCLDKFIIKIDPIRFEQIVLNLLDNSLKYSNPGSTTTIIVKKENNKCLLSIQDEGAGIPPKDMPYIFDRLYRVEKSRSRLTGGVGLGLSIVKELVDAHDGTLSIESELGKGTTVTIALKEFDNETTSTY